jgi:hypothetical protein
VRAIFLLKFVLLTFALRAGLTAAASAQDADTVSPAPAPQSVARALPADLQTCLQETGDYVTRGRAVFYVIAITNICNTRLRCEIFANVTGVKGSSLGHTAMILGPAGSGAAAKKSYIMPVKAAGGTVMVSRECKVL